MMRALWARARELWQARSRREQVLLGMVALLAVVVAWDRLVWTPLAQTRAALLARVPELARQAAEAEALAMRVRARGHKPAQQKPLLPLVEEELNRAGLRKALVRLRPEPGERARFLLELRNAPFLALVRFIKALGEAGVDTASLRLERASSGRVHARVVVER